MESLLVEAKKVAAEAEVFLISVEEMPVTFQANRLKQVHTRQGTRVALRIVNNGRIGFSAANDLADIPGLVSRAVEVSQFGPPAMFELPSPQTYPQVEVFDPDVNKLTLEPMVALGESIIAQVRQHTPDVLCNARITRSTASIQILNSRGGQASYKKTAFAAGFYGMLIKGTDMLFVGDGESSCHPLTEPRQIVESVIRQLEWAKRQAKVASGKLPVVFTPHGVASALIEPLTIAFNGRIVLQGASPLGRRQGESVFDPRLSLWDDATLPYRPTSRACDEEGVPSQRTSLIDKGVVSNFLYDLQTAGLAGTRSTGNASRAAGGLPAPAPSALVVGQGEVSFQDMLSDLKEGLVVEQLMGAEQGNILGGDFSGNVLLGYKVERGEITGRVKDTTVAGNVYEALQQVVAIGSERRWVDGSLYTPAIYCAGLAVSSKG